MSRSRTTAKPEVEELVARVLPSASGHLLFALPYHPHPAVSSGAHHAPPPGPVSPATFVSLQGTLRTGIAAIGGETTGVILQTAAGTYELDLGNNVALRNAAAVLNGQEVNVTGYLTVKNGVEISQRFIVRVVTLDGSQAPPFQNQRYYALPVQVVPLTDTVFAQLATSATNPGTPLGSAHLLP